MDPYPEFFLRKVFGALAELFEFLPTESSLVLLAPGSFGVSSLPLEVALGYAVVAGANPPFLGLAALGCGDVSLLGLRLPVLRRSPVFP